MLKLKKNYATNVPLNTCRGIAAYLDDITFDVIEGLSKYLIKELKTTHSEITNKDKN